MNLWYNGLQTFRSKNLKPAGNHINASIGASVCGESTLMRSLGRKNDSVKDCRIKGESLHEKVFTADRETEQSERGVKGICMWMTVKYPERIGDHAVNIAGWAEYPITGIYKTTDASVEAPEGD